MNLTESQRQAVETQSRDVLVIAGAGSGKTEVFAQRVCELLKRGASPGDILCITFTNRAAAEMEARIVKHTNDEPEAIRDMRIGTFHSIAYGWLRTYGEKLGYRPATLTICTPGDSGLLLKQVAKEAGTSISMKRLTAALEAVQCGEMIETKSHDELIKLINEYNHRLREMNSLDFGGILIECKRLLGTQADIRARINAEVKHVLVDEVQDLNLIQWKLLENLAPPASLYAVGDIRQSIYGWRGARPDILHAHGYLQDHLDAKVINLRECFRCGDKIVEAANNLISWNADTLAEPMVGATGQEGLWSLETGQSLAVARLIGLFATARGPGNTAVLARTHKTLRRIGDCLDEIAVPYHRVGSSFAVCETEEFRQLHAAMRLCCNPWDNLAFLRLVPVLAVDGKRYAGIRALAAKRGHSHFSTWCHEEDCGLSWAIKQLDQATHCPEAIRIISQYMELPWPVVEFWTEHCPDMGVAHALRWFALRDSQDDATPDDADVVTLSTVHAAKGLEWPCVFVVELNEGGFPSTRDLKTEAEARRLFYVAITRAGDRLVLCYRLPEDQAEGRKINEPSRFLTELKSPREAGDGVNPCVPQSPPTGA